MKYDDDELAEAALLLAQVDREVPLSRTLEDKLHAQGTRIASEARYTTSRLGAMEVDGAPSGAVPRAPSRWSPPPAWYAAAAGIALLVHQLRGHQLTVASQAAEPPPAAFPAVLVDANGAEIARITTNESTPMLVVRQLPRPHTGDRYQLWVSAGTRDQAMPVGFFKCQAACADASFRISPEVTKRGFRAAWISASPGEQLTLGPAANIVAELRK
jgi:hypothetical protein